MSDTERLSLETTTHVLHDAPGIVSVVLQDGPLGRIYEFAVTSRCPADSLAVLMCRHMGNGRHSDYLGAAPSETHGGDVEEVTITYLIQDVRP